MANKRETELEALLRNIVQRRAQGQDINEVISIAAILIGEPDKAMITDVDKLEAYRNQHFILDVRSVLPRCHKPAPAGSRHQRFLDSIV